MALASMAYGALVGNPESFDCPFTESEGAFRRELAPWPCRRDDSPIEPSRYMLTYDPGCWAQGFAEYALQLIESTVPFTQPLEVCAHSGLHDLRAPASPYSLGYSGMNSPPVLEDELCFFSELTLNPAQLVGMSGAFLVNMLQERGFAISQRRIDSAGLKELSLAQHLMFRWQQGDVYHIAFALHPRFIVEPPTGNIKQLQYNHWVHFTCSAEAFEAMSQLSAFFLKRDAEYARSRSERR